MKRSFPFNESEKKTSKKQKVIPVSFKDTPTDNMIYQEVCKHSSKGGWIKDVLLKEIQCMKKGQE